MLVKVPVISITVRRDALTITPSQCLPHEIGLLGAIFGRENVTEGEPAGEVEIETLEEYERLSNKYGPEAVSSAFRDDGGVSLEKELADKYGGKTARTRSRGDAAPDPLS